MKYLFFALFFTVMLNGCYESQNQETAYLPSYSEHKASYKKEYIFGVHPLHNPIRLYKVYQPLVEYINKELKDAVLVFEASKNYAAYDKKLANRHFDIALPNPYQTLESLKQGYHVFGKMADDNNFRGIILVRKDSNIKEFEDLKGKKVSYPAPTALAATMMPQWLMYQNGVTITKDITNLYVGSQESSIMNVVLKESVAGATWPPPWLAFQEEHPKLAKQIYVKWETKALINNGLVAKQGVPKELVSKIASLLFNLHTTTKGQAILERIQLSKFEQANDETYDVIKIFMQKFETNVRKANQK